MSSVDAMKIILQIELAEISPDVISRAVDEVQRERDEGKAFLTEIDALIDAYERLQRPFFIESENSLNAVAYYL